MGRLILVRHGESEGNATRTFTHTNKVPITPLGAEQARRSAALIRERFAPVRLFSSPYRRAWQTAEIIAEATGHAIEEESEIREQSLGDLHGQPYESALASPGFDEMPRWEWRPPAGETLIEVQARALAALRRIARAHAESEVIAVSHNGTIHSIWAHTVGSWEEARGIPNAGILLVTHDGERFENAELLKVDQG